MDKDLEKKEHELIKKSLNKTIPPDEERLLTEISCRDMIESCYVYHLGDKEATWNEFRKVRKGRPFCPPESYATPFIGELGKLRVQEIFQEEMERLSKKQILKNVGRDAEGNSYHALVD